MLSTASNILLNPSIGGYSSLAEQRMRPAWNVTLSRPVE
jgi:hypothetical protein